MRDFPRGGLIGKTVHTARALSDLRVPLYAANACYFLVLAVFPALLLILGLLRYTNLAVEQFGDLFQGLLPEALVGPAQELILITYDNTSGFTLGVSAVTALWSASRGIYGILTGLNAIYDVQENRSALLTRLLCVGYTFAFLLVVLLTLGLHVFGGSLLSLLEMASAPFLQFLLEIIDFRFVFLLLVQTGIFTLMFMVLPNRPNGFFASLPGGVLAAAGWQIFSNLYSVYVDNFASLSNVYGSVYAVALSMLWLYCCVSIFFYGGALNRFLSQRR